MTKINKKEEENLYLKNCFKCSWSVERKRNVHSNTLHYFCLLANKTKIFLILTNITDNFLKLWFIRLFTVLYENAECCGCKKTYFLNIMY